MNILFVSPKTPNTFWSFSYALKFVSQKANFPPLGLITVAAMLPKPWNKKLVDMNIEPLKDKDILWADFVFISAMIIHKESTQDVIRRCKELGVKTVGGGPLFTAEYQEFDDVDHILMYEGERTIPRFLKDLEDGTAQHLYDWEEWPDLSTTPVPLWELVKIKKYTMLNLQYSRGCPFHCEFCNVVSLFGHTPRTKSVYQLVDELNCLYDSGWRGSVFFVDDNFIGNRNKLKNEVLPAIIAWMQAKKYPFKFFTEVSVNLADDEPLMELMVEAGFDNVFVGIETVCEESLAECHKTQNTNRDLEKSVKAIQHCGLQVQGGFILGFDNDKPSIFEKMTEFIQKSGIVTAMVGMLNAPKGTELHKRLEKEGRLATDFSGTNTDINFIPKMNINTLRKGYESVVNTIYSPKHYFERVKGFLKRYSPPKHVKKKITFANLVSFAKTSFLLGIFSKERVYYWRLLLWSLFKKPTVLPMAVTFTVYGYHFRKSLKT